ncbi:MAG: FAD-dependent oxidoreductase [Alphaproteobacteria bacterium]
MTNNLYLTDAQLQAEIDRCLYCADKPCLEGCPVHCSPADFIMAAKQGAPQDIARAAKEILAANPLGHVCGIICPDNLCMGACSKKNFDKAINIPAIQATVIKKARDLGVLKAPAKPAKNGRKVAVIGAGPAGIGAAAFLGRKGYEITLFDERNVLGGAASLIPDCRLPDDAIKADYEFTLEASHITLKSNTKVEDAESLLKEGFDAVLIAVGEPDFSVLGVDGELENALPFTEYLKDTAKYKTKGNVAIIGGGAVAVDCATEAKRLGSSQVEMFVRRTVADMRLTSHERQLLLDAKIDITTRTRVEKITEENGKKTLTTCKTTNNNEGKLVDIAGTSVKRPDFDLVILAIGGKASYLGGSHKTQSDKNPKIFYAGDCVHGGSTAVEAVASGKNAALDIDALLNGTKTDESLKKTSVLVKQRAKSRTSVEGINTNPVDLTCDFFGFKMSSPFILSAAPHTDGIDQMKLAYQNGWTGGVLKTSFDGIPIHVPAGYMFAYTKSTFANCDNVSDHALERVCREVEELRKKYPDRLTMASTGGPVTGHEESDRKGWQSNTKKLEDAGVIGVEYSLSCPQGGDGTEGDIVSQNAALTQQIIEYVLEAGNPDIPKIFKLTAAVTSIVPIINAVKGAMANYPKSKVGITLANSFPTLGFRPRKDGNSKWDEGVVAGMAGEGVLPISYLTLANAAPLGVFISGNGGPMDYRAAANFLALGVRNVQFCSIAMKHGVHIIKELNSGLSHLLEAKRIKSVNELIGCALPNPITDFMDLPATKQIPTCNQDLCLSCGNCTNCGYQAVTLDANRKPVFDPNKCVGCTYCTKMCFTGALSMKDR